jgi:ubiquinone/menaquinone biosynthesis C-methylase UbiE
MCLVCRSDSKTHYLNATSGRRGVTTEYSYYKCLECGMVYLDPPLSEQELAECYDHLYEHEWGQSRSLKQKIEHFLAKRLPVDPPGKLLDVGCGSGAYLAYAEKLGWEVTGVDQFPHGFTERTIHPAVKDTGLKQADFAENSFDVITMWWVIEHYQNPLEELQYIRKVIKPNGTLAISTCDIESMEARLFGRYWHHSASPEHCALFSVDTLKRILDESGFELTKVRYVPLTAGFVGSIYSWIQERRGKSGVLNAVVFLLGAPFEIFASAFKSSGLFTILATPK